jgi:hypothetical protein
MSDLPATFGVAAVGVGDLRPVFFGLLLLLAMACVRMVSAAAEVAREAIAQLKRAIRAAFYSLVVTLLVVALVLFAFADFVAQR